MALFSNYSLAPFILKTLEEIHFNEPTPIQELVIPKALKGNDIIGRSKTGSGKTHAYLLPLLNKIEPSKDEVQALILTPTRELAQQVYDNLVPFIKNNEEIRTRLVIGGLDITRDFEKTSIPHIVVGTPGRIKDIGFIYNKLNLSKVSTLVIDEADMIFEAGFMDDVNIIAANLALKLQMLVFSATIPQGLANFLDKYMHNPLIITPSEDKEVITPSTIEYYAIPTRNKDKKETLLEIINTINPFLCSIFSSKIETVNEYFEHLRSNGINCGILHGDMSPTQRRVMLKRINNHEFVYVVASDIAARGIDIEGVSHVINIDYPIKLEFFFHRSGRTGRMGNEGLVINIYHNDELPILKKLNNMGVNFEHKEINNGEFIDLRPLFREKPREKKKLVKLIEKFKSL